MKLSSPGQGQTVKSMCGLDGRQCEASNVVGSALIWPSDYVMGMVGLLVHYCGLCGL